MKYEIPAFGFLKEMSRLSQINEGKCLYNPERIIFNPPATIVFWGDSTKTVVKCREGTEFNQYFGFCAALAKKIFGSNNSINRIVEKGEFVE